MTDIGKSTLALFVWLTVAISVVCAQDAQQRIDFQQQVWPILQQHCHKCHGDKEPKGELRLDSREALLAGGHTGGTLIAATHEQSELYLRVASTQPRFRMPPKGPSLSIAQLEIIKQWIDQGAAWDEGTAVAPTAGVNEIDSESLGRWHEILLFFDPFISGLLQVYRRLGILSYVAIALLILILFVERSRRKSKRNIAGSAGDSNVPWLMRIRRPVYLAVCCCFPIIAVWVYFRAELLESENENTKLKQRIAKYLGEDSPLRDETTSALGPIPPRPNHPPRMSGVYYRGNDERDPELFNGGFYRTANIRVWLTDDANQPLNRGDEIGEDRAFVSIEIERAKHATTALFTAEIMSSFFLSRQVAYRNIPSLIAPPVYFEEIDDQNRWIARYPIATTQTDSDGRIQGMIYLYRGDPNAVPLAGVYHYGIRYDIGRVGNRIDDDSEIWMGSLHNSQRVITRKNNGMFLNEWFDFRPIPEIEQRNSQDPTLLGIPEYQRGTGN